MENPALQEQPRVLIGGKDPRQSAPQAKRAGTSPRTTVERHAMSCLLSYVAGSRKFWGPKDGLDLAVPLSMGHPVTILYRNMGGEVATGVVYPRQVEDRELERILPPAREDLGFYIMKKEKNA